MEPRTHNYLYVESTDARATCTALAYGPLYMTHATLDFIAAQTLLHHMRGSRAGINTYLCVESTDTMK